MKNNSFATFDPIEDIVNYYKTNNITPQNDFMSRFLENNSKKETITPEPVKDTSNAIDIKNLLSKYRPEPIDPINWTANKTNAKRISPKDVINFFMSKGYTKEQSAGIAGNLHAESGLVTLRPQMGGGPGFGLAQWEGPRQADFKRIFKKDIKDSTSQEQLEFINWELDNTEKSAKRELLKTKTPQEAAATFAKKYERMKKYNKEREAYASKFYSL